jgi:uracil-DNA glycosylase
LPTFHPSALLRDPEKKRDAWDDFQKIRAKLNEINESGGNAGDGETAR